MPTNYLMNVRVEVTGVLTLSGLNGICRRACSECRMPLGPMEWIFTEQQVQMLASNHGCKLLPD